MEDEAQVKFQKELFFPNHHYHWRLHHRRRHYTVSISSLCFQKSVFICLFNFCFVDDAENGGCEEGVRGDYSEHSEGGSGESNGVGAQSSSLSARSTFYQRRVASRASPLKANDRFQGLLFLFRILHPRKFCSFSFSFTSFYDPILVLFGKKVSWILVI